MSDPVNATPPIFRDVKKAEASGIIIATDVLCPICNLPSPTEEPPHRKCLDRRVIETFERTMASNTQVVESNRQVAQIFSDLNATMQKVAGQPTATSVPTVSSTPVSVSFPEGTFKVSVTGPSVSASEPPTGSGVLFPFPNAVLPMPATPPPTIPKLSLKQRRAQAILARRRAR